MMIPHSSRLSPLRESVVIALVSPIVPAWTPTAVTIRSEGLYPELRVAFRSRGEQPSVTTAVTAVFAVKPGITRWTVRQMSMVAMSLMGAVRAPS